MTLEAAWEPRLRIIGLVQRLADVCATDERGDSLPAADRQAQQEALVDGQSTAVKLDLPLQLPSHRVERIASLKGKLSATILGRIETFRFSKLADAKNVQQRIAGVTVTLEQVRKAATVVAAGEGTRGKSASRCDLTTPATPWPRIANGSSAIRPIWKAPTENRSPTTRFETTAQDKNEVGLAYLFRTDRPLDDLTFVYKTPGTIVTSEFDYELKEIKLP